MLPHILLTLLNCCNTFLIGVLYFYLWFIGHTAVIFILLKVIILTEQSSTQISIASCFLEQDIRTVSSNTFKIFSLSSRRFCSYVSQYLSVWTNQNIFVTGVSFYLQLCFPLCLAILSAHMYLQSRYIHPDQNWFFSIRFIAELQPFVMRQTTMSAAIWNKRNATTQSE